MQDREFDIKKKITDRVDLLKDYRLKIHFSNPETGIEARIVQEIITKTVGYE